MAENSKIEWCHSTFNPWRGCTKVSPGCANCYAETLSHRNPGTLGVWGPKGTRVVAAAAAWREPLKWDKRAAAAGERHRVFCASLADVFEDWTGPMADSRGLLGHFFLKGGEWGYGPDSTGTGRSDTSNTRPLTMDDVRVRLFRLIDATPNLDWLVLTKRPENIARAMPAYFPGGYIAEAGAMNQEGPRPNVWLGTSVENQAAADERHPHLKGTPCAVDFWSAEPLLGSIDALPLWEKYGKPAWVIVGGESGGGARPCNWSWVKSLVEQCKVAAVPCFVKQLGAVSVIDVNFPAPNWQRSFSAPVVAENGRVTLKLADRKGGDIEEWPADLRVREFPTVTV